MKVKHLLLMILASGMFVLPTAYGEEPEPASESGAEGAVAKVDEASAEVKAKKRKFNPHRKSTYIVESRNFKPEISGGLKRENIRHLLKEHRDEIEACYKSEYAKSPVINGRVGMHVLISKKGEVIKVFAKESTLGNYDVAHCIAENIKTWRFAVEKGGGMRQFKHWFVFEDGKYIP